MYSGLQFERLHSSTEGMATGAGHIASSPLRGQRAILVLSSLSFSLGFHPGNGTGHI